MSQTQHADQLLPVADGRSTTRVAWRLLRARRGSLALTVAAFLVTGFAGIVPVLMIGRVVDVVRDDGTFAEVLAPVAVMLAAAVVALVVAVLLLPVALKPRPRRTLALRASSGVHLRRQDLVRVVRAAIDGTDGVTDADVSVRRRRVKVVARSVATSDRESELEGAVRARAERVCSAVDPTPRVDVTIRPEKG